MTEFTRWVVIDNTDSRISYSGSWSGIPGGEHNSHGNFGRVYEDTLQTTTTPASSLSFRFTGNAVRIYATSYLSVNEAGVSDPDWDCILDGSVTSQFKKSPTKDRQNNWEFCRYDDLSPGEHTISLAVRTIGRPFLFDKIHYRPTSVVENETMFITRDDADLSYDEGRWGPLAQVAYFTSEAGGSVTFPFIGTAIQLAAMAPTERPHGASRGAYRIDNGDEIPFTIPEVGSVSEFNRLIFRSPQLSPGRHTVTVTSRGGSNLTPLVLSGFIVSGGTNRRASAPAPAPPSSTPDTTTSPPPNSGGSSTSPGTGTNGDSTNVGQGQTTTNGGLNSNNGNGNQTSNTGTNANGTTGNSTNTQPSPEAADVYPEDIPKVIFMNTSQSAPQITAASNENSLNGDGEDASTKSKGSHHTGAIVGGVIGVLAVVLITASIFVWLRQRRSKARRQTVMGFYSADGPVSPQMEHKNTASLSRTPSSPVYIMHAQPQPANVPSTPSSTFPMAQHHDTNPPPAYMD